MSHPILIAGPNVSLDRTHVVAALQPGHVHRSLENDVRGGGKGINVARATRCIGRPATVVGFLAGHVGAAVRRLLAEEGIELVGVASDGETRSCLTVLTPEGVTVFNEPGPPIDGSAWDSFERDVRARLRRGGVFACSGSFPPGAPDDGAGRLIAAARDLDCITICDTSRRQLSSALHAEPDVLTPNLAEARAILEGDVHEPVEVDGDALGRASEAATALRCLGPRAVLVTVGAAGAALAANDEVWRLPGLEVRVRNPVGAGDCLVAGLADGLGRGLDISSAARWGMSMAAASCETLPAGLLDERRAATLLDELNTNAPGNLSRERDGRAGG